MKKIEITKDVSGYIWYSDQDKPRVFRQTGDESATFEIELKDGENPFIIEGQLYDAKSKLSLSIKFIDGEYMINEYNAKVSADDTIETYFPNSQIDISQKLKFIRRWREQADELCLGKAVLKPAELVFIGFSD